MYQPAPLNWSAGAESGRMSSPEHLGQVRSGVAEKLWIFSKLWPQLWQRYS